LARNGNGVHNPEIYTHLTPDAEKRAADKMEEIFRPVAVKKVKEKAD
jgi:hypothetical protein